MNHDVMFASSSDTSAVMCTMLILKTQDSVE